MTSTRFPIKHANILEAEGDPLSVLKPRLGLPLDGDPNVGITTGGMGVLMLGMFMEGKEVTVDIPQMETPDEMGKDGVGPMALMDDKEDIIKVPPLTLVDGIEGSATLDETLGPDIMRGSLNKEKGSLKCPLNWMSTGSLGPVKGGLK
jgi:hypothetical protein